MRWERIYCIRLTPVLCSTSTKREPYHHTRGYAEDVRIGRKESAKLADRGSQIVRARDGAGCPVAGESDAERLRLHHAHLRPAGHALGRLADNLRQPGLRADDRLRQGRGDRQHAEDAPGSKDRPGSDRRLVRDMSEGRIFEGETINYRKDGSEFVIDWRVIPVTDDRGDVLQYLAIQRDISANRNG
ncbi:PAS domain-containing protein [Rubrobacter aplysinae]|uniref:PAS domain-containing protein n=1 Tax=Rubrobacter aplysinae TaxID=909625 RepID=UPI002286121D|nr:PAS domain-containing protein [Rubrobacter aplysinae]